MKVEASGLELKNVLIGIHRYQWDKLEELCSLLETSRAAIVREAIDLWLRAYDLKMGAK